MWKKCFSNNVNRTSVICLKHFFKLQRSSQSYFNHVLVKFKVFVVVLSFELLVREIAQIL